MSDELEILGVDVVDLGLPVGIVAAAALGLKWVAGPSLQAVGKAFGEWTDIRTRNLLRLGARLNSRSDESPGTVPPRLLYRVLEDGSWLDDDVAQEYLAGILVGARSPGDEDGVFLANLISTLTSTQLRVHFAMYAALAAGAPTFDIGIRSQATDHGVWAPIDAFRDFVAGDKSGIEERLVFAALALEHAGLIDVIAVGGPEMFAQDEFFDREPPRASFVAIGTVMGAALYTRAHSGRKQAQHAVDPIGPLLESSWVGRIDTVPAEFA